MPRDTPRSVQQWLALGLMLLAGLLAAWGGGSVLQASLLADLPPEHPLERSIALWPWEADRFAEQVAESEGEFIQEAGLPIFDNQVVTAPVPRPDPADTRVRGLHVTPAGVEKWIEVDLSDFRLTAWEGDKKVYEFLVSTGRPGYRTVTGEFRVWRKVKVQAYRGGSKARGDYYFLPNVRDSLFFHGGYAIHAAYWHVLFGKQNISHGCVNVHPDNMKLLYEWAGPAMPDGVKALNSTEENPGTRVVIHD